MRKPYQFYLITILLFMVIQSIAQPTYKQLAGDTIVIHDSFLNTSYLLNGKRLNPVVMEWFMSDYPEAYEAIRISNISEQISTGSYIVGSLFLLSSFLTDSETRPQLVNNLQFYGGLGLGGGILFQLVSGKARRNAVDNYNQDIRQIYRSKTGNLEVRIDGSLLKGVCRF